MSKISVSKALVHITDDNGKGVGPNVSLLPIRTCSKCVLKACAMRRPKKDGTLGKQLFCYAEKFLRRPIVLKNWTENTQLIEKDPNAFYRDVAEYLETNKPRFFRFWVGGDFPSQKCVNLTIALAKQFPAVKFLAFTKRWYDRFNFSKTPANLAIIYSAWPTLPVPPTDKPRAWFRDLAGSETRIPKNALHCPGRCDACGMCWELPRLGLDVVFDEH